MLLPDGHLRQGLLKYTTEPTTPKYHVVPHRGVSDGEAGLHHEEMVREQITALRGMVAVPF